jgi:hypothetical protein
VYTYLDIYDFMGKHRGRKTAHKQQVLSQIRQSSEALDYYQSLDPVQQEEYLRQYSPDYALKGLIIA